jgi:hypothetical protein
MAALEVGQMSRPGSARPEATVTSFPVGAGGTVIPSALGAVPQVDVRIEASHPQAKPTTAPTTSPALVPLKSAVAPVATTPVAPSAPAQTVTPTQTAAPPVQSTPTHSSSGSGEFDTSG